MSNDNRVYYKVLDKDMRSPWTKFQYELNKRYSTDEELVLCESGFHVCKEMYEMIIWTHGYNNLKDCRFFECTLGNKIIEDVHKVVSNSITLIKEIPFEEVDKSVRDNLDILVHDGNWRARRAVALQGYGLDTLVHDKNDDVRRAVAYQGYGLDILVHDKAWLVRKAIALQGYGLDILINDTVPNVRVTVADQGYGLDILIKDESLIVRNIAKYMLEKEKRNG